MKPHIRDDAPDHTDLRGGRVDDGQVEDQQLAGIATAAAMATIALLVQAHILLR